MNNIDLEKFIYKDLQNKNYEFYFSKSYKSSSNYTPQIYALKPDPANKQSLTHLNLKVCNLTTQKMHNFLHKRPIIIVKGFNAFNPVSDNVLLCSILKQGLTQISSKDISSSLEKYITNIQPLSLVENVFSNSQDKIKYFKHFSQKLTLQSINLKNLDLFFLKNCSVKEKEDFVFWFISKRSKELQDITIEKKITTYLLENWSNDPIYLNKFLPFSQYLTNQILKNDLDIFDNYSYSAVVEINLLKTSKFIGLTTNKINNISEKFFKEVEKYHNAQLKTITDSNNTTFVLQHNTVSLEQVYLKELFHRFLTHIYDNNIQKVDSEYCEKWYLHEVLLAKLPTVNTSSKLKKI